MVILPAGAIGLFVAGSIVFAIGYILTLTVSGKILDKLEERQRKTTGRIPPVDRRLLNVESLAIVGGIAAVVLVLALIVTVPFESKVRIYYGLIGVGIIAAILSWLVFGRKSQSADNTRRASSSSPPKPAPEPIDARNPRRAPGPAYQPPARNGPRVPSAGSKESLYQALLMKTRNNRDLADRLIEYERKRKPDASEAELIKNAIDRWERDNY